MKNHVTVTAAVIFSTVFLGAAGQQSSTSQPRETIVMELLHYIWPSASRVQALGVIFGAYILSIVVFGILYYRWRDGRFFIPSQIVESRARDAFERITTAIAVLTREIKAMEEVRTALASGDIDGVPATLPSGHKVETRVYTMHNGPSEYQDRLCLTVVDGNGVVLCNVEGPQDESLTPKYFIQWLEEMLNVWYSRKGRRQVRLTELLSEPEKSFNLWDFIYFSGITQTTVGFGDILPNSTRIRIVVLIQILWGYFLLAFILNVVLAG